MLGLALLVWRLGGLGIITKPAPRPAAEIPTGAGALLMLMLLNRRSSQLFRQFGGHAVMARLQQQHEHRRVVGSALIVEHSCFWRAAARRLPLPGVCSVCMGLPSADQLAHAAASVVRAGSCPVHGVCTLCWHGSGMICTLRKRKCPQHAASHAQPPPLPPQQQRRSRRRSRCSLTAAPVLAALGPAAAARAPHPPALPLLTSAIGACGSSRNFCSCKAWMPGAAQTGTSWLNWRSKLWRVQAAQQNHTRQAQVQQQQPAERQVQPQQNGSRTPGCALLAARPRPRWCSREASCASVRAAYRCGTAQRAASNRHGRLTGPSAASSGLPTTPAAASFLFGLT